MTNATDPASGGAVRDGQYARVGRERRFLLAGPPPSAAVPACRRITLPERACICGLMGGLLRHPGERPFALEHLGGENCTV